MTSSGYTAREGSQASGFTPAPLSKGLSSCPVMPCRGQLQVPGHMSQELRHQDGLGFVTRSEKLAVVTARLCGLHLSDHPSPLGPFQNSKSN